MKHHLMTIYLISSFAAAAASAQEVRPEDHREFNPYSSKNTLIGRMTGVVSRVDEVFDRVLGEDSRAEGKTNAPSASSSSVFSKEPQILDQWDIRSADPDVTQVIHISYDTRHK